MTIRPGELKAQRKLSAAFIRADYRDVSLLRRTRTDDGAGGTLVGEALPLAPQRMRLLPQEDGATARTTAEGETATPEFMLMAEWDADMERFDEFEADGARFQIVYVDDRKYELKGEAIRLGN